MPMGTEESSTGGGSMREILYRGMLSHKKKWVEGNLIISNQGKPYIYPKDLIEQDGHHLRFDTDEAFWVIPETVGEYTGILDKNGMKVFEGDILRYGDFNDQPEPYIEIGVVEWDEKKAAFIIYDETLDVIFTYPNFEIIGNIHDNPELLEKE